jgi:glycosyltransferase involved in cell wall biosynthesis
MKILIVTCVRNRPGGILNFTEQLMLGFKELGHHVELVQMKPIKQYHSESSSVVPPGFVRGEGSGVAVNQLKGWRGLKNFSMMNEKSVREYVEFANTFDLIIQSTMFGYACQDTEGDTTWLPMIKDVKPKQVMVLHDGNMKRNCPWLYELREHFDAIACVHHAALGAADFIDIPRNIILNPFDLSLMDQPRKTFSQRENKLLSPQTFKPIKHVQDLIRAVPHMKKIDEVIVAGEGIEFNYMTSKDKCKEHYFVSREIDPDASQSNIGRKIWDVATENGKMKHLGVIHPEKRDEILREVKFLVDSSWSRGYGEHYNRTLFEAMLLGVVPIAVNLGVSDNEEGIGELLKPGVNYLMLRHDYTPKQYAEKIDEFVELDDEQIETIVANNDELLRKLFDRKNIAQQYINLSQGQNSGLLPANLVGSPKNDPNSVKKSREKWIEQFEVTESATLEDFFS